MCSFAFLYLEPKEFETLRSDLIKIGITLVGGEEPICLYVIGSPIISNDLVVVDGVAFYDCIEMSIRHFFNFFQPYEDSELTKYWSGNPEILDFFLNIQGKRKANSDLKNLRNRWAIFCSKIPGLVYGDKTNGSPINNVEIKAGWFNFLKAIAHLRKRDDIFHELSLIKVIPEKFNEIPPILCRAFKELAGEKCISIVWVKDDNEGIRTMLDGSLDPLGRMRVTIKNLNRNVDFIMMNGHGWVEWENQA